MTARSLPYAIALLVASASVVAEVNLPHGPVQQVVADLFADVAVGELMLSTPCPGGAMNSSAEAGSFHFEETDEPGPTAPIYPGGYFQTGCGQASYTVAVPAGTDHIHVRFFADRVIGEFNLAGFPFHAGIAFNQSVQVFVDDGPAAMASHAYFEEAESARERRAITIPTVYLPDNATSVRIVWIFEDRGTVVTDETQDSPQGVAFAATVDTAMLEFSGVPLKVLSVRDDSIRSGKALVREYRTRFEAPASLMDNYAVDLRLRIDEKQQFESLRTPNGTSFTTLGTRFTEGPDGFDRNKVLQENPGNDSISQITIPTLLSEQFGAGIYEVRTAHTQLLDPTPALVPVAILVLALPFPFGVLAFVHVRAFEREAFGAFRRAGSKLRWALVAVALYYLAVVLSALPGRRLDAMVLLPLSADGWILYGQVVIAILAFVALWLVANELFGITRPKEPPKA